MTTEIKRSKHLRVPVFKTEEEIIVEKARQVNLSIASYLRNLGLGFEPSSVLDGERVMVLAEINAAQSSLGNLLKLALTKPELLGLYENTDIVKRIDELTKEIKEFQGELLKIATSINI